MIDSKQQAKSTPLIGITMGDPTGVGPEVVVKALSGPDLYRTCRPWVIGDEEALRQAAKAVGESVKIKSHSDLTDAPCPPGSIHLLQVKASGPELVIRTLETAASLALAGRIEAVVTAPIRKKSLVLPQRAYPGHTEFFAEQADVKEVGMMLVGGPLKVMLATTHIGMAQLPSQLTLQKVQSAIRLAHWALKNYFGISSPKIAVAALNPHAGEGGLFGQEEARIIGPAAEQARTQGISATPPLPADTAFRVAAQGEYDVVVAMYHDQALIPIKLLAFGKAVNLTVGLPFIRTSVDHGTGDKIVGKDLADPGSLIAAIHLAVDLIHRQGQSV